MTGTPHIAILGRPNVGKSTMFNRLVGRRIAIVDSVPGITRDRLEGVFEWEGRKYLVSDLAGWDEDPSNPFAGETTAQINRIANEADVLVLMVDARDGPTAWDRELAEKLRVIPTPVILVVNKCDNVQSFPDAESFWELGMGEPVPVSATHNLNIDVLLDRIAVLTEQIEVGETEEDDEEHAISVAIVGRQNVGKSTLFNALIGQHRAIVSEIPGTTRDAVDTVIEINDTRFRFIDTAGLKKRTKVTESVDFYAVRRTEHALARCEVALLLIDCTDGVTDTDLKIAGIVQKSNRACIIVASKWDESDDAPGDRQAFMKHLVRRLHFLSHAPVVFTSGLNKEGLKKVYSEITRVHTQFTRRESTSVWNQTMQDAITSRPPPTVKGKRLKLNYITQTSTAPPTVTIFVNQPDFLRDQYKRYLERMFRRRFGFEGAPIVIQIRRRRSKRKSPVS